MDKIWIIARKDIISTFTDRNLLLIMLATPLALAAIIALAFSDLGGGSSPLTDIPVALVNLDVGDPDTRFDGGLIFVSGLLPDSADADLSLSQCALISESDETGDSAQFSLEDLTETTLLTNREEAIAGVDNGDYVAAIIIPENFSQLVSYRQEGFSENQAIVEVYGNSGNPISASVIRSVAESFTNQIVMGQVTIGATIDTMVARAMSDPSFGAEFGAMNNEGTFVSDFNCAFDSRLNNVGITSQTVAGEEQDGVNFLVLFGSAQAAFFALFTASGGASSIMEERRNGTLQRLLVSPTSRMQILLGKLIGTFATVLLQLVFLFIGFTLLNTLLEGEFALIWGENIPAVLALVIALALAASGVGMIAAAVAKTAEQANVIGSVIAMFMGVLGGAFFQLDAIPAIEPITRLSVVFWGSDGFGKLSEGNTDIFVNLAFLTVIGVGLFMISLILFNRRQDI